MAEYVMAWQEIYSDLSQNPEPETKIFSASNDRRAKLHAVDELTIKAKNAHMLYVKGFDAINLPTYRFRRVARVVRDSNGRWEKSELVDISDVPAMIKRAGRRAA